MSMYVCGNATQIRRGRRGRTKLGAAGVLFIAAAARACKKGILGLDCTIDRAHLTNAD